MIRHKRLDVKRGILRDQSPGYPVAGPIVASRKRKVLTTKGSPRYVDA